MGKIIGLALMIALFVSFWISMNSGIEHVIENQDTMLCESAKVSGNIEYQKKCGCYYDSGDIKCLQPK
jgi:hypothetical protein